MHVPEEGRMVFVEVQTVFAQDKIELLIWALGHVFLTCHPDDPLLLDERINIDEDPLFAHSLTFGLDSFCIPAGAGTQVEGPVVVGEEGSNEVRQPVNDREVSDDFPESGVAGGVLLHGLKRNILHGMLRFHFLV